MSVSGVVVSHGHARELETLVPAPQAQRTSLSLQISLLNLS